MPKEADSQQSNPERHPFKVEWEGDGSTDDVTLRFFWDVPVQTPTKRLFEQTLLDKAEQLVDDLVMHYMDKEFEWRKRSRPKGVPKTTPAADKVSVYTDFVTSRFFEDETEPFHQLLDAVNDFQPPIRLVKIILA